MAFVLDASVTACWAFEDEDHPDAAYLELAQREALPLATLDADLRRAAAETGVALVLGV